MTGPVCGDCERTAFADAFGVPKPACVFIVMAPGKDGQEWHLCGRCFNDGRKVKVRKPAEVAVPVSDAFMNALEKSGWTRTDNGDGTETVSPPDRRTAPRRRKSR